MTRALVVALAGLVVLGCAWRAYRWALALLKSVADGTRRDIERRLAEHDRTPAPRFVQPATTQEGVL